MANPRVQSPPINLKERIAALEQRTAAIEQRSAVPTRSASPVPSGIPQLATNNALRDKIAKFEKKGGIPVPRGRFGMGAPPTNNAKPRKQGELYGNRMPRTVSGNVPALAGSQSNRRSMSLSVNRFGYDSSSSFGSRSASPCPSDYDGLSDGLLSPDASKSNIDETEDATSHVPELTEAQLSPRSEVPSNPENHEEISEVVPEIVTSLVPDYEDTSTEVITSPHQRYAENGNLLADTVEFSPTHEEQEDILDEASLSPKQADVIDEASPSPKQEYILDEASPSPKQEDILDEASPYPKQEYILDEASPSPKQEDIFDEASPSPKQENSQLVDAAISSSKLEEFQFSSVTIHSPKLEGEYQPSDEVIALSKLEEEPRSLPAAIASPKLEGVQPSPTLSLQDIWPSSATKLMDSHLPSPAVSSPELKDEEPISPALPSPEPQGTSVSSPAIASPGLASASPLSSAFPSPRRAGTSPLSISFPSPKEGLGSVTPSPKLEGVQPISATVPSLKLEDSASPLSAAFPSPRSAGASPLSVSFPSPRPKERLGSATPSPKLEDVQPISATVPSLKLEDIRHSNTAISATPSPKLEDVRLISATVPSPKLEDVRPTSATIPSPKLKDIRHSSTAIPSPRSAKNNNFFSPTISSPKPEVVQSPGVVGPSPTLEQEVQVLDATVLSPSDVTALKDEKRQSAHDIPILSGPAVESPGQLVNVEDKIGQSGEAQDAEASSVSRSSSLRTLTPTSHAPPSIVGADDELEPTTKINVPVISLSPPATESIPFPLVSTSHEVLSPQESERIATPISAGVSSPSTPISPPSPKPRSPDETLSRTTSPVKSAGSSLSNARPAMWRHSSADERLSNLNSPVAGGSEGAFRSPLSADPALTEQLSEQILQMLLPKGESLGPGVTLTSPPPARSPDSPLAQLAYDVPDRRATIASPSYFSQPDLASMDALSPAAGTSSDMFSPLSSGGVISPGEIVTAQRIATSTVRGVPVFFPRKQVDYSHFPPTPDVRSTEFRSSLPSAAISPTSPTSRFKHPPPSATAGRSNTFHAVVRGKVKEPASAIASFSSLGVPEDTKARQSKIVPNGELATLLQDAALLEHALTQGALFDESRSSDDISELAESGRQSEEQDTDKEDEKRLRRHATLMDPNSLKNGPFRLPLRKKTKHWKASPTNVALKDELLSRPSLEDEHSVDSTHLQINSAASKGEGNRSKAPDGFKPLPKPPRPRLISGLKKLTGTGSTRSLNMPVAYSRQSASISSEQSSEDSMPVATPPDPSVYYSDSAGSSNIAWPSVSPKRSGMRRAASFAEKLWNRARTKSSGSTLSANESKDRSQHEAMPTKPSSSSIITASSSMSSDDLDLDTSRPSSRATYKLDVLPPSEPLFDAESFDGSDILSPSSLPNPFSPGSSMASPSDSILSPPISVLTNPHSLGDNDSWISEPSTMTTDLFDAFPSVPQAGLSTPAASRAEKPLPSINVARVFDNNHVGPQSALLPPKRNATVSHLTTAPHTAATDGGFLGRATTMPRQHPSADSYPRRF